MTKKTKSQPGAAKASATITLAGRVFSVPPLPLRINREAYPLCHRIARGPGFASVVETGALDFTGEELDDLAQLAYLGASAGDPELTREDFDNLPITPGELLDAFFIVRVATGGWVPVPATA